MAIMLRCCSGCNTWHKTDEHEEYYRCENCGKIVDVKHLQKNGY